MAACERTKQPFGITVDKICSGQYKFVWAFKIDKEKAQREGDVYKRQVVVQQKTKRPDYKPVIQQALQLCGERPSNDEALVFEGRCV